MSKEEITPTMLTIMKLSNYFPKSNAVCCIMILLKIIPMVIITHDWNINAEKGVSYWMRKFNLSYLFALFQMKLPLQIAVYVFFCIGIAILVIFFQIRKRIIRFKKSFGYSKIVVHLCTLLIYIPFYFLNQQIYGIYVEAMFCSSTQVKTEYGFIMKEQVDCRGITYIATIPFIIFNTLFSVIFSVIIQSFNYDTFFISNNVIMNQIGSFDLPYILVPFIQVAIQLEFHIPFSIMIIIKHVIRALYSIYYIMTLFQHKNYFVFHYFDYLHKMILGMCFFSCLIEWGFYYDINNYLTNLVNNSGPIILKILVEFLGAKILTDMYYKTEKKSILEFINSISLKKKNNYHSMMFKLLMIISKCEDKVSVKSFTDLIFEITKENKLNQNNSNNALENVEIFQSDYYINFKEADYQEQQENFINNFSHQRTIFFEYKHRMVIKDIFPLLHDFLNFYLQDSIDTGKGIKTKKQIDSIFCLLTFYLVFEKNIFKCLLIVEYIKSTSFYKKSYIFRIQTHLMQKKLFNYYKNNILKKPTLRKLGDELSTNQENNKISEMHLSFKSILTVRFIEDFMKGSLNYYIDIMNRFNEEDISFPRFIKMLTNFKDQYDLTTLQVTMLSKVPPCSILYSSKKYDMFFSFFNEIPTNPVTSAIDLFFTSNSSLMDQQYSLLILKVNLSINENKILIDYASDELKVQLGYSCEEFIYLQFNDLIPNNFIKSYSFLIDNMIKKGKQYLTIKNLCLLDKEKYFLLFDVFSVLIYASNSLQVFLKLTEAKEQKILQYNNKTINKNSKKNKKKKQAANNNMKQDPKNYCGNCLLFTNKNGKIFTISRDFEKYFFLSSNIMTKHRINIKDIIRIETLLQEGTLTRNLNLIYEDIIQLNSSEVGQLGEDEFSQAIVYIKETQRNVFISQLMLEVEISYEQRKLKKNKLGKLKKYYLFNLQIIRRNKIDIDFSQPNTPGMEKRQLSNNSAESSHIVSRSKFSPFLRESYIDFTKTDRMKYNLYLNNKIECQKKIILIRYLSVKLLEIYFKDTSLKNQDGFEQNIEKYFPKDSKDKKSLLREKERLHNETYKYNSSVNTNNATNAALQSSSQLIETPLVANNNTWKEAISLYEKIKKKSHIRSCKGWKVFSGLTLSLFIIVTYLWFSVEQLVQISKDFSVFDLYHQFMIMYFRLVSLLSCVVYMQFQANKLQDVTIDSNFTNTFDYYLGQLLLFSSDYSYISNSFVTFLSENNVLTEGNDHLAIINVPHSFVSMTREGKKTQVIEAIGNINYLTLSIRQVELSNGFVIFFNRTDSYVDNVTDYYSQNEHVKIIENYLGIWKYLILDLLGPFEKIYIIPKSDYQFLLSYVLIALSMSSVAFNYIWLILFLRTKMGLFSKYFALFTELRFFNLLIRKKTQVVLEYIMNNGDIDLDIKEIIGNIGIANEKDEIIEIKNLCTEQLSKISMVRVQPFKIKLLETATLFSNDTLPSRNNPNDFLFGLSTFEINNSKKSKSFFNSPKSKPISNPLIKKISLNRNNSLLQKLTESKISLNSSKTETKKKINFSDQNSMNSVNTAVTNKSLLKSSIIMNNQQNSSFLIKRLDNSGKKLLEKPFNSLGLLIFMTLVCLACIGLNFFKYILTFSLITNMKEILSIQYSVFAHINLISEMLIAYQIAVLKNDEITVQFNSTYNISYCLQGNKFNEIESHNVFDEIIECIPITKSISSSLFVESINNRYLKNTIQLQKNLYSNEFCKHYSLFLFENKNHTKINAFNSLKSLTYGQLLNDCESVGKGFNSEGLDLALESMYIAIENYYADFRKETPRTEESNIKRLTNPTLLLLQAEFFNVIQRIPYLYMVSFSNDLMEYKNFLLIEETIVLVSCIALILLVNGYYLLHIFRFNKEEELIEFFDDTMINTILY